MEFCFYSDQKNLLEIPATAKIDEIPTTAEIDEIPTTAEIDEILTTTALSFTLFPYSFNIDFV